jgi:hypothetical protein
MGTTAMQVPFRATATISHQRPNPDPHPEWTYGLQLVAYNMNGSPWDQGFLPVASIDGPDTFTAGPFQAGEPLRFTMLTMASPTLAEHDGSTGPVASTWGSDDSTCRIAWDGVDTFVIHWDIQPHFSPDFVGLDYDHGATTTVKLIPAPLVATSAVLTEDWRLWFEGEATLIRVDDVVAATPLPGCCPDTNKSALDAPLAGTNKRIQLFIDIYSKARYMRDNVYLVAGSLTWDIREEDGTTTTYPLDGNEAKAVVAVRMVNCDLAEIGMPCIVASGSDAETESDSTTGFDRLDDTRAVVTYATNLGNIYAASAPSNLYIKSGAANVVSVDTETLEVTAGPATVFDPAYYFNSANEGSFSGGQAMGVGGFEEDNSMGCAALTESLAVVGYLYVEFNVPVGVDPLAYGDPTGSDIDTAAGPWPAYAIYNTTKICPLVIDGMTITPRTPVRVSQRTVVDIAADEIRRLNDRKGIYVWAGDEDAGYAAVFELDDAGNVVRHQRTLFADDPHARTGAPEQPDNPDWGTWGFLMGSIAVVSEGCVVALGANGNLNMLPLRVLRIDDLAVAVADYRYVYDYEVFPYCVTVGDGKVFVGPLVFQDPGWVVGPPTPPQFSDSSFLVVGGVVVEVDPDAFAITDITHLGVLSAGTYDRSAGFPAVTYTNGRGFFQEYGDRATRGPGGSVFVANDSAIFEIDPLCQTFPQSYQPSNLDWIDAVVPTPSFDPVFTRNVPFNSVPANQIATAAVVDQFRRVEFQPRIGAR